MADRRMFSKQVVESDKFFDLSHSAQCLYFHLCLNADDDGFINNPNTVIRSCACSKKDLDILVRNEYVIWFAKSGICVIKHFKISNYIQKDRYTPTKCAEREKLVLSPSKIYELSEFADADDELPEQLSLIVPQEEPSISEELLAQQNDENTRVFSITEVIKQIYDAYPCHKGKAKGIEYAIGFLRGRKINGYGTVKFNHEQLYCAARHYAIECQNNGTEPAYMKQFSTFMNKPVIDYVEYARENGGYEKYMKSRYGDDWERLEFVYVK